MKRLLITVPLLLIVFGISGVIRRRDLHFERIAKAQQTFIEWQGYSYQQVTDTKFSVEGVVVSMSPNGGVFCSGPFEGGPGTNLTLRLGDGSRRKAPEHGFAAFGDEKTEPLMKKLRVGSHVRISGTEGTVSILKGETVAQRVEPTGHWWALGEQDVVVIRQVDVL
jgi:hypothetical protein